MTFYVYTYFTICFIIFVPNFAQVKNVSPNNIFLLPAAILAILTPLFPAVIVLYLTLAVYQVLVTTTLKLRHGSKFLGLFTDVDALHANTPHGKCTINVLLILESLDIQRTEDDIFKIITNLFQDQIINYSSQLPKFCSRLCYSMGYSYMLQQSDIQVSDCVKKMGVVAGRAEITRDELTNLVNSYVNEPLPYNNQLLWDVHVGTQPLVWKANSKNRCYPILLRLHHSVTDAVSISEFVSGVCGYNLNNHQPVKIEVEKQSHLLQLVRTCQKWAICIFLYPCFLYSLLVIKKVASNVDGSKFSTKKGLVLLNFEDTNERLLKIKKVAKKCNANFMAVLLTAFSASLRDYYRKFSKSCPNYVTAAVPFHPRATSVPSLKPGTLRVTEVEFQNKYVETLLVIPVADIKTDVDFSSLNSRLSALTAIARLELNSSLYKVSQVTMKVGHTMFPEAVNNYFGSYINNFGPCVSSVPGFPKINFADKYLALIDYIFFIPDQAFSVCLFMTTYDGRMQLALTTPSGKCSKAEAEFILNGIYKHIDDLEKEINASAI